MKKASMIAAAMLAFSTPSFAQALLGFGWDNANQEVVGRIGLGGYNAVEAGLGFAFDDGLPGTGAAAKDFKSSLSLSGRYLLALHQWDKLTGYLHLGGYFRDDNTLGTAPGASVTPSRAASLAFMAGYEPQITLLDHFAVSTRFGLALRVMDEFAVGFSGEPVSIVTGINFRILL
jgi:hypothetical protein